MPRVHPPLVGLLGARRERQSLGPHLARRLEEAGARIVAFGGRSAEHLRPTREALERSLGHEVSGHLGVAALLAESRERGTPLDALVIAAPIDAHESALEHALEQGVHVLCEKPMIDERGEGVERARRLVQAFEERSLALWVNVQWPETLSAYETLYPVVDAAPPRTFGMRLAPGSLGSGMLRDALHHPLSLLQAKLPHRDAGLEEVRFFPSEGELADATSRLAVEFLYRAGTRRVECRVELHHQARQPRPASYGFDGRIAHRSIREPGYRQFLNRFAGAGNALETPSGEPEASSELQDPMGCLVGAFVAALRAPRPSTAASGVRGGAFEVQRLSMLRTLTERFPRSSEKEGR